MTGESSEASNTVDVDKLKFFPLVEKLASMSIGDSFLRGLGLRMRCCSCCHFGQIHRD